MAWSSSGGSRWKDELPGVCPAPGSGSCWAGRGWFIAVLGVSQQHMMPGAGRTSQQCQQIQHGQCHGIPPSLGTLTRPHSQATITPSAICKLVAVPDFGISCHNWPLQESEWELGIPECSQSLFPASLRSLQCLKGLQGVSKSDLKVPRVSPRSPWCP